MIGGRMKEYARSISTVFLSLTCLLILFGCGSGEKYEEAATQAWRFMRVSLGRSAIRQISATPFASAFEISSRSLQTAVPALRVDAKTASKIAF